MTVLFYGDQRRAFSISGVNKRLAGHKINILSICKLDCAVHQWKINAQIASSECFEHTCTILFSWWFWTVLEL